MTRKRRLTQALFDNYINESQENKQKCQELVFEIYFERNMADVELAIEEIRADIIRLEYTEQYERCAMLKDILDRLE
jgi:hypothetical protein